MGGTGSARAIDVVLFDLGGVLIDFGGVGPMRDLAGIDDDEEVWRRWLTCRWVRAFERGGCSAEDFAAGVVGDWGLRIAPDEFLAAFGSWLGGALPGAAELVAEVQAQGVATGCLSNTNALHAEHQLSRWPFVAELEHRFLSFEIGLVKPDREVFDHVAACLGSAPERILFLDDNQLNVDGAATAGLRTARVRSPAEARAALVASGVLGG